MAQILPNKLGDKDSETSEELNSSENSQSSEEKVEIVQD
jgi:hypothetical protein